MQSTTVGSQVEVDTIMGSDRMFLRILMVLSDIEMDLAINPYSGWLKGVLSIYPISRLIQNICNREIYRQVDSIELFCRKRSFLQARIAQKMQIHDNYVDVWPDSACKHQNTLKDSCFLKNIKPNRGLPHNLLSCL